MKILEQRLLELRTEKGISQKELSKCVGASDSAICFWEKGINEPKASYLVQLAKFFDVSSDYLLGLEDDVGARTTSPAAETIYYSSEECEIIKKYRSLPDIVKKLVRDQLEIYSSPEILISANNKKN